MDIKNTGLGFLSLLIFSNIALGNGFHSTFTDTASLGQGAGGITRYESSTTAQDLPAAMPFLKKGIHTLAGVIVADPRFTLRESLEKVLPKRNQQPDFLQALQ